LEWGCVGGRKENRVSWSFGTQKDRKLERKGGIMSGMQCCTSLEHSYNSVHGARWLTVFLTRFFTEHPITTISFKDCYFLLLFPKKCQVEINVVGNFNSFR
jgi:hypothetical protein